MSHNQRKIVAALAEKGYSARVADFDTDEGLWTVVYTPEPSRAHGYGVILGKHVGDVLRGVERLEQRT